MFKWLMKRYYYWQIERNERYEIYHRKTAESFKQQIEMYRELFDSR